MRKSSWLFALSLMLTGCVPPFASPWMTQPLISKPLSEEIRTQDVDIVHVAWRVADDLLKGAGSKIDRHLPILAASFVNQDNLEESSSLGRLLSQKVASRFVQKGYQVTEVVLRKNLLIKKRSGTFLLSRALQDIRRQHQADAAITGRYTIGLNKVYGTGQLIRIEDGSLLASSDFMLPLGPNTRSLLEAQ